MKITRIVNEHENLLRMCGVRKKMRAKRREREGEGELTNLTDVSGEKNSGMKLKNESKGGERERERERK